MKYLLILLLLLLSSCTEFHTKMDMMQNEQMSYSLEEESLCAGWKV